MVGDQAWLLVNVTSIANCFDSASSLRAMNNDEWAKIVLRAKRLNEPIFKVPETSACDVYAFERGHEDDFVRNYERANLSGLRFEEISLT